MFEHAYGTKSSLNLGRVTWRSANEDGDSLSGGNAPETEEEN
jgi:hypothetical protein